MDTTIEGLNMKALFVLACLSLSAVATNAMAVQKMEGDVQAKTASGDEVILHPDGYWEYVDTQKAEVARKQVDAIAREEGCPRGTRASFFGVGRCIANDDPVLKRGSLSGKGK